MFISSKLMVISYPFLLSYMPQEVLAHKHLQFEAVIFNHSVIEDLTKLCVRCKAMR